MPQGFLYRQKANMIPKSRLMPPKKGKASSMGFTRRARSLALASCSKVTPGGFW